LKKLLIEQD
jgi:hypothetical protein